MGSTIQSGLNSQCNRVASIEHNTLSLDQSDTNSMLKVRNLNSFINKQEYLKNMKEERMRLFFKDNSVNSNDNYVKIAAYPSNEVSRLDQKLPYPSLPSNESKTSQNSKQKNIIIDTLQKFEDPIVNQTRNINKMKDQKLIQTMENPDYFALDCTFKAQ